MTSGRIGSLGLDKTDKAVRLRDGISPNHEPACPAVQKIQAGHAAPLWKSCVRPAAEATAGFLGWIPAPTASPGNFKGIKGSLEAARSIRIAGKARYSPSEDRLTARKTYPCRARRTKYRDDFKREAVGLVAGLTFLVAVAAI